MRAHSLTFSEQLVDERVEDLYEIPDAANDVFISDILPRLSLDDVVTLALSNKYLNRVVQRYFSASTVELDTFIKLKLYPKIITILNAVLTEIDQFAVVKLSEVHAQEQQRPIQISSIFHIASAVIIVTTAIGLIAWLAPANINKIKHFIDIYDQVKKQAEITDKKCYTSFIQGEHFCDGNQANWVSCWRPVAGCRELCNTIRQLAYVCEAAHSGEVDAFKIFGGIIAGTLLLFCIFSCVIGLNGDSLNYSSRDSILRKLEFFNLNLKLEYDEKEVAHIFEILGITADCKLANVEKKLHIAKWNIQKTAFKAFPENILQSPSSIFFKKPTEDRNIQITIPNEETPFLQ